MTPRQTGGAAPLVRSSCRGRRRAPIFRHMPIPEPGSRIPRRGGAFRAALGRAILRLTGWRIESVPPDQPKLVVLAAPHSSNWDFVLGIALVFALRLDLHFIGKAELFRGPLRPLMRRLGGLPGGRRRPPGVGGPAGG